MGRSNRSSREVATRLAAGLAEASATAAAFRAAWQRPAVPADPHDRMALEHERQQRDYHRNVRAYERTKNRLRSQVQYLTATGLVAGSAAAVDFVAGPGSLDAWFWVGAPTAVISGIWARSASRRSKELKHPVPPTAPPPPPRPLPPGFPGAHESAVLHRVRVQLAQLIPTIEGLHEDAAIEIRRADFEAAPAMAALVERLAVLHRVEVDMTGSAAATTAAASAAEIRARLAQGVAMYEELLNAALQMLSAPDPASAPSARLSVTVQELAAYSEGLRVAAASSTAP